MNKVLIFAGTTEGRDLAEYLAEHHIEVFVCAATEYGGRLIRSGTGIKVSDKRLDSSQMQQLIEEEKADMVIDATHPYAVEVSANIREACKEESTEYIRLLRESSKAPDNCIYVDSTEDAVSFIEKTKGNILLTTGSKELKKYVTVENYKERLYARVLSTKEVAAECADLGFEGKNLICMQGPFSEELNYALIRQVDAKYIVTKESGATGGYLEKINAAKRAGIQSIVIGRPIEEEGVTYSQCIELLNGKYSIQEKKEVTLAGIGMGSVYSMTAACEKACVEADIIIGAKRVLESLKHFNKPMAAKVITSEIVDYVKNHPQYSKIVVALSGDIGFYSGAKKLYEGLKEYDIRTVCGISSVVYLASKLRMPWEDIKLLSAHGREANYIAEVKRNQKTFMLLGTSGGVKELCSTLIKNGLSDVHVFVGTDLSYENEKIEEGRPEEFLEKEFSSLSVVLIENKNASKYVVTHGIKDEEFIRGEVPMTKEEIRSISLSKLCLQKNSVIFDIGAGTGSVSIEMASQAYEGWVYAVEKNEKGIALIEQNCEKFGITNLSVINETAPFEAEDLPVPTHAFIGGSSGNMKEILQWLFQKNPEVRIVINTVTLESLSEAMNCIKELGVEDADITHVSVAKNQRLGRYNLMKGLNPIYIISFTRGAANEIS